VLKTIEPQAAAGALVWREREGRLEVLLVHRPRYRDWSWPKGKVEPGEHPLTTACREVAEETGHPVILGIPLPTVCYRIAGGRRKRVYYWAARIARDDDAPAIRVRPAVQRADPQEIDRVRWCEVGRARKILTRRSDRVPLDSLTARWRAGLLETRAVIVLRHGKAVGREKWAEGELTRPLTGRGRRQAEECVPLLAAFGVREVWTSPWRRCRQTVKPYARAAKLTRHDVPAVTEAAAHQSPGGAARAMRRALASEHSLVLCTHRPVLRALFGIVAEAALPDRRVRREIPARDPYLRTAEMLVVHVATRPTLALGLPPQQAIATERHRPT
jgi:8-oxo-dGTP diphosphatase